MQRGGRRRRAGCISLKPRGACEFAADTPPPPAAAAATATDPPDTKEKKQINKSGKCLRYCARTTSSTPGLHSASTCTRSRTHTFSLFLLSCHFPVEKRATSTLTVHLKRFGQKILSQRTCHKSVTHAANKELLFRARVKNSCRARERQIFLYSHVFLCVACLYMHGVDLREEEKRYWILGSA
jgi:hypothetical protein